jgi:hypothetical protein
MESEDIDTNVQVVGYSMAETIVKCQGLGDPSTMNNSDTIVLERGREFPSPGGGRGTYSFHRSGQAQLCLQRRPGGSGISMLRPRDVSPPPHPLIDPRQSVDTGAYVIGNASVAGWNFALDYLSHQ